MLADGERVKIVEVSPRDGLQGEQFHVATEDKLSFINKLAQAGLSTIEATSCVPARWVPQLADHDEVIRGLPGDFDVEYLVLVPNVRGFQDAKAAGAKAVSVIASASESFSRRNANCSVTEGLERCQQIIRAAKKADFGLRGYISCSLGCPFEGEIAIEKVIQIAESLFRAGCDEVVLSDTIGVGTPGRVSQLIKGVSRSLPISSLAVHFHDTYGQALANILAALEEGVRTVDGSVAGLGGCPYAKAATGNVATEDLLYMLDGLGCQTGIDLIKLIEAGRFICDILRRENSSRVAAAIGDVHSGEH